MFVWMNKIVLMRHSGKLTIIHQQREGHEWTDHETTQPVIYYNMGWQKI